MAKSVTPKAPATPAVPLSTIDPVLDTAALNNRGNAMPAAVTSRPWLAVTLVESWIVALFDTSVPVMTVGAASA